MQLLYIHDKGLGDYHPIFSRMNANSKAVFIWDDAFFKRRCYSLKRLVFIYETLCSMPIEIYYGDTKNIIKEIVNLGEITSKVVMQRRCLGTTKVRTKFISGLRKKSGAIALLELLAATAR